MGRLDLSRKHPADAPHSMARSSPAGIVTYRLQDKMVYVTPAETFEQAVEYAKTVFPEELGRVEPSRISFSVSVVAPDGAQTVQIGPMAWAAVIDSLARYEIIDILVQPAVVVDGAEDTPPKYADVADEENQGLSADRKSPSPSTTPKSRTPSPSAAGRRDKALSWIKHL